ncbi:MAG: 50S ribosomal protein L11 methyltransferase [Clostridia bacterium]|nr:50S ribosomal protein L11 methyltransferase [Clostridia bacterium]
MDWTDITLIISTEDISEATSIAHMVVPRGLYIEDYSTFEEDLKFFGPVEIIDEALLNADKSTAKIHIYISPEENPSEAVSFLKERLDSENIGYTLDTGNVCEEDWANNWKQFFKPMNIGEKIRLIPSWEAETDANSPEGKKALAEGRKSLIIDPGMAFGSGQHETTRLCLELIEKNVNPGTNMLDVGTGSGILGIAGLLLGVNSALGVDIDPLSVKIAGENADLNGIGDRFKVICGNLADEVSGEFDLISANIVADIIMMLLPDAKKLLKKDGIFIASGIIDTRRDEVVAALEEQGLEIVEEHSDRGWYAISAKHR